MSELVDFNARPIMIVIAGPNGTGKTTFFHSHLAAAGLRFVNADVLAAELDLGAYEAARLADSLRRGLVVNRKASSSRRCSRIPWVSGSPFFETLSIAVTRLSCVSSG